MIVVQPYTGSPNGLRYRGNPSYRIADNLWHVLAITDDSGDRRLQLENS